MRFEEALNAMREGKILTIKNSVWKYRLIGSEFKFCPFNEKYRWSKFINFPYYLLLLENWEIVDD